MSVETNLRELFGVDQKPESFDHVAITVANPEIIRGWSKGEVKSCVALSGLILWNYWFGLVHTQKQATLLFTKTDQ